MQPAPLRGITRTDSSYKRGHIGEQVNCFQRVDPNWGPKEFGAVGDGSTNDFAALNKWLQANQPHIGDVGIYATNSTLSCVTNPPATISVTIQGPENLDGAQSTPLFEIKATAPLGGPVIDAQGHCRLSGVAINANNQSGTDAVDVDGDHVTIDGFSMLENGVYNLSCGNHNSLIVRDTILTGPTTGSTVSNFYAPPGSGCGNVKLEGDIFQAGSGTNVVFGQDDLVLSDSTIESAGGIGLDLTGAQFVSVTGNNIDSNGETATGTGTGPGIKIKSANTISVCGNHIEGNGGVNASSSQIYFDGTDDNIDFCSNTYFPKHSMIDATFRPSYVYDASNNAVLTNSHFYESAPPQAGGAVYSNRAAVILPQLHLPHIVANEFSGFTLSNDGTSPTKVDITSGEAADSTNSTVIQLPNGGCSVDLSPSTPLGPGGLDAGSVQNQTTYFYFLIGSASGGSPACMASASTVPTFVNAGSPYSTATSGSAVVTGSTITSNQYLYNVSSIAGLAIGQLITGTDIPSSPATTINGIGTLTVQPCGTCSIGTTGGVTTVTVPSTTNIGAGMTVSDGLSYGSCTAQGAFNNPPSGTSYTVVAGSITSTTFNVAPSLSGGTTNDCITISGGNTITLSQNASGTQQGGSVTIYNGLYRMVGALYTYTPVSTIVVIPFIQDGSTFYLTTPTADINTTVGNSDTNFTLSVPCGNNASCSSGGISVEAFGRVVGGSLNSTLKSMIIYNKSQNPNQPQVFPTVPGYSSSNPPITSTAQPGSAYPFRLYTDSNGRVRARGSAANTYVYEMTDGWVFHGNQ